MPRNDLASSPSYPIGSVDKALRLLLIVSGTPEGLRVGQAGQELQVAPSTAHRLLQMLVHYEFATQDPATKAYFPGPALRSIGHSRDQFLERARPVLSDLAEATQETVHLSVMEGQHSVTLLTAEGPHMLRVGNREGHAIPLHSGAMARCLLMDRDAEEIRSLSMQDSASDAPEGAEAQSSELVARVAQERARGYAHHDGEVEQDVSAIAVPVRGDRGVEYAIGVTYPTARVTAERIPTLVDLLRSAAASLTLALRG